MALQPVGHRAVARPLRPRPGRHLPAPDPRRRRGRHPASRRLPRPPDHRPGVRRQGRALPRDRARQDGHDAPRRDRACSRACPRPSSPPATTAWSSTAPPCPLPRGHRLAVRTAPSWACATARDRSRACSSTPKSIASEHGHQLLRNFLDLRRGAGMSDRLRAADRPGRRPPADTGRGRRRRSTPCSKATARRPRWAAS